MATLVSGWKRRKSWTSGPRIEARNQSGAANTACLFIQTGLIDRVQKGLVSGACDVEFATGSCASVWQECHKVEKCQL